MKTINDLILENLKHLTPTQIEQVKIKCVDLNAVLQEKIRSFPGEAVSELKSRGFSHAEAIEWINKNLEK